MMVKDKTAAYYARFATSASLYLNSAAEIPNGRRGYLLYLLGVRTHSAHLRRTASGSGRSRRKRRYGAYPHRGFAPYTLKVPFLRRTTKRQRYDIQQYGYA
jgi:hypothetical protein